MQNLCNPSTYSRAGGVPRSVLNLRDGWPFQDLCNSIKVFYKTKPRTPADFVMPTVMIATYAANLFTVTWNVLAIFSDTTTGTFWFTWGLQICGEVWMLLSLAFIFRHWRRPLLPRMPITLASKILFVYATDIPSSKYAAYQESDSNPAMDIDKDKPSSAPGGRLLIDADYRHGTNEKELRDEDPAKEGTPRGFSNDHQIPGISSATQITLPKTTGPVDIPPPIKTELLTSREGSIDGEHDSTNVQKRSPKPMTPLTSRSGANDTQKPPEEYIKGVRLQEQSQASTELTRSATLSNINVELHEQKSPNETAKLSSAGSTMILDTLIRPHPEVAEAPPASSYLPPTDQNHNPNLVLPLARSSRANPNPNYIIQIAAAQSQKRGRDFPTI